MPRSLLLVAVLFLPSICGCAGVGEAIIDGVFESILGDDDEIEPRILKRKGIEPGSGRHKRLLAEEQARKDLQRSMSSDKWP
jgi:hypothetical protein